MTRRRDREQVARAWWGLQDKYNAGIEPLENWETNDLILLAELADATLELRAHEESFPPFYNEVTT